MLKKGTITLFEKDIYSKGILDFIRKNGKGELNQLDRALNFGSRVTVLDRLNRMEEAEVLKSRMELDTEFHKKNPHITKWMRVYYLNERIEDVSNNLAFGGWRDLKKLGVKK